MTRRAASRHPARFREAIIIEALEGKRLVDVMEVWQQRDLEALDAGWLRLAGRKASHGYLRAYLERPRGHSKTTDMALQLVWILQNSDIRLEGVAAAADRDQAGLIHTAMQKLVEQNAGLCRDLVFRQHAVINSRTSSRLTILSSDAQSSWGLLPDFVICDELSHWEKPDLWYSLISSAAKKPNCMLVVLTNAGVGRGWQWEVREAAQKSSRWYFSSLDGCQAKWISQNWLEEQREMLPGAVFDRLWNNRWQLSDGSFISVQEAEACRDESLKIREQGRRGVRYFAAIDFAEKHDFTVGVLIHWEGEQLVVDRMDVVQPRPDQPVQVAWVEKWIEKISTAFGNVCFVVDEYQLLSTIQKFESRVEMERFAFGAGKGNHALAINLRQLILRQGIRWYAGCGQLNDVAERNDLETELTSVMLRLNASGRCRIDHLSDGVHHDDRVFALGAAALKACETGCVADWMEVSEGGLV